jgi:probable O-glycosylation ligase (exosortase A-associated)
MALSLGVEGAKQGWFHLVTSPTGPNTNIIPFLGDNNGVAVGMLMLAPLIAYFAQSSQRLWIRYAYVFLLIGVIFRALSTYSRGGFLACLVMVGLYWLRSKYKLRSLLAIIPIVALILPALPDTYWDRMRTIQTYEEEQEDSALSRLHFWAVAVDMAQANPLFGVGLRGYASAYNDYDFLHGRYGQSRAVHSSWFGILAELGYPGIILFALILFNAFRTCHRIRKAAKNLSSLHELGQMAIALEAGLVAYVIGGSFLSFQYTEILWHFIVLTIVLERLAAEAVAESHSDDQHQTEPMPAIPIGVR